MKNNEKCLVLPSKLTLKFQDLPENDNIEFIAELEIGVSITDVNGEKIKDSNDAVVNIEDAAIGLNISFTLYQLQCISLYAEKLVQDSIENYTG